MRLQARPLMRLIEEFERMPGIGPKSAQRLAYYVLNLPREEAVRLAEAIVEVKDRIRRCTRCCNFSEEELCPICQDSERDRSRLCVVGEVRDLVALERMGEYKGLYHVLGGLISPMDGVGPDHLTVKHLLERIRDGGVQEVILALNPVVEGDATAMYLARLIKPLGPKVTRIALGLPVGGDLDYADQVTIARAMEGRREME